jgi:hypothetical protein
MLVTNRPLMSPQQPSFQKAGYAVAGRQQVLPDLGRAMNYRVPISLRLQVIVPTPPIGFDFAARRHHRFQGRHQRWPRGIAPMSQTGPSDGIAWRKLDRQQHPSFPSGSPTPLARLFAAQITLLRFDDTFQAVPPRTNHRPAQLVQPSPRRLVAPQPQQPLDGQGARPVLLVRHLPPRAKPPRQRQAAALQDRSDRPRGRSSASSAKPPSTAHPPCLRATAGRAPESVRPSPLLQIKPACLFCRKLLLQLHQRPWVCFPTHLHYHLGLVESNG